MIAIEKAVTIAETHRDPTSTLPMLGVSESASDSPRQRDYNGCWFSRALRCCNEHSHVQGGLNC